MTLMYSHFIGMIPLNVISQLNEFTQQIFKRSDELTLINKLFCLCDLCVQCFDFCQSFVCHKFLWWPLKMEPNGRLALPSMLYESIASLSMLIRQMEPRQGIEP
jgi:hypothetical protein